MKTLKKKILFTFLNCASQVDNSGCMDCGDGILDGFLYKEVILTDIPKLNNIAGSAEIGDCIRFKMDGDNFIFDEIVENCCCNLFK
tara:strand:- start:305 stop:562 length:258 start_codon:yes stop_codon:yes gene_type:complete